MWQALLSKQTLKPRVKSHCNGTELAGREAEGGRLSKALPLQLGARPLHQWVRNQQGRAWLCVLAYPGPRLHVAGVSPVATLGGW